MLHHANKKVAALFLGGVLVTFGIYNGHRITEGKSPTLGQPLAGPNSIGWPKPQPTVRVSDDAAGKWFEVGIRMPATMPGNCADGWMLAGELLRLQSSTDLVNWSVGGFTNATGSPVTNGDGSRTYWSRSTTPLYYKNAVMDLTLVSNRYGKSITSMKIGAATVSLAGFPYAMPADIARLQADFITAGFTGAVVSNVSAAMSVEIINHYYADTTYYRTVLAVTLDGSANVTAVTDADVLITLPSYPYAMPSQQTALQADLRAAGKSGAVVKLFGDSWTIFLPDRTFATNTVRTPVVTFTPNDLYPAWDMLGTYIGNQNDNTAAGTEDNIRTALGGGEVYEASKQFFRY